MCVGVCVGVCWCVCWCILMRVGVCWCVLVCIGVCCVLVCVGVCWCVLVCVGVCVGVRLCWCVCPKMHHQRWVGRAAERCLDATASSVVVCVGDGVCPEMHHQRWVGRAAERCLDVTSSVGEGRRAPPRTPPPGTPFSVRWQGPHTVCVGITPTCVRWKKYMEKVCQGFSTITNRISPFSF